jgi:hypothetical protein
VLMLVEPRRTAQMPVYATALRAVGARSYCLYSARIVLACSMVLTTA